MARKRIGNDVFEKFRLFFSKYTKDDVAPLNLVLKTLKGQRDVSGS